MQNRNSLLEKKLDTLNKLYEHYQYNRIDLYYTDSGKSFNGQWFPPRALYKKYLQFFVAGKYNRLRTLFSGNRVGKSEGLCGYESALHATGMYPSWWDGLRFNYPPVMVIAGKTMQTVRDIIQDILFGNKKSIGTGLIPKNRILDLTSAAGTPGAYDTAYILFQDCVEPTKIMFRAYSQGRGVVEGMTADWLWVDEEPGLSFFNEAWTRLTTTEGHCVVSFTPLEGFTEMVRKVLPDSQLPVFDPMLYSKEVENMIRNYE